MEEVSGEKKEPTAAVTEAPPVEVEKPVVEAVPEEDVFVKPKPKDNVPQAMEVDVTDSGGAAESVPESSVKEEPQAGASSSETKKTLEPGDNDMKRERILMLLSALYYKYGEEWAEEPDWKLIAEQLQKIPLYGEGVTVEWWKELYESIMIEGFEFGNIGLTFKAPKILTDSQKRLWILCFVSTDIVHVGKGWQDKIAKLYQKDMEALEEALKNEAAITDDDLKSASEDEIDEEELSEDEYESPEANLVATEIQMLDCMEDIAGLKDSLKLTQYCYKAVEHAVRMHPILIAKVEAEGGAEIENILQEADEQIIHIQHPPFDDPKSGDMELPSTSKATKSIEPGTASPVKTNQPKSPEKKGEVLQISLSKSPVKEAVAADIGKAKVTENVSVNKSPVKSSSETAEVPKPADKSISDVKDPAPASVDSESNKNTKQTNDISEKTEQIQTGVMEKGKESGGQDKTSPIKKESETVGESKSQDEDIKRASPRKTQPPTRATRSRLTSPEPSESPSNNESLAKRTRGRHGSSDANQLVLRSRKSEAVPPNSVEKESKSSQPAKETTSEDTSQTANKISETPEAGAVPAKNEAGESIEEIVKPKLRTYSAKPPSPLSQVDPKIFDDFNDDEDDPELAMIDNNVHKSKVEKSSSPTKSYPKRGRTVSTDNGSDIVEIKNEEEGSTSRRITRRGAPQEDTETTEGAEHDNDETAQRKRLTRSSLKIHDAANDDGTDKSSRAGSEKAPSESSVGGKERKSRSSVTTLKKLEEADESLEEKRVTRARAKPSIGPADKRSRPSETEGEGEPTPTRTTRSRASTSTSANVSISESVTPQQVQVQSDDEDSRIQKKIAMTILDKIIAHDSASVLQKYIDDPEKLIKPTARQNLSDIKQKIESGKIKSVLSLQKDLTCYVTNVIFSSPTQQAKDAAITFFKMMKETLEEQSVTVSKVDNSDVESHESHEESQGGVKNAGGRRKRRRSASETSEETSDNKQRRVTRTSASSTIQLNNPRKLKHPVSPDIVSANRTTRH